MACLCFDCSDVDNNGNLRFYPELNREPAFKSIDRGLLVTIAPEMV